MTTTMMTKRFPDDDLLEQNLPEIEMNSSEKFGAFSDLRTEILSSAKKNFASCKRPTQLKQMVMSDVKAKYGDILTFILIIRIAWSVYQLCRWIWSHCYGR